MSAHPPVLLGRGLSPKAHFFQVIVRVVLSLPLSRSLSVSVSLCSLSLLLSLSFSLAFPLLHRAHQLQTLQCVYSSKPVLVAVREKLLQHACVYVCVAGDLKDPSRAAMLNLQCSSSASTAVSPPLSFLPFLSLHHPLTPSFLTACPSFLSFHIVVTSQPPSSTSTRCVASCVCQG